MDSEPGLRLELTPPASKQHRRKRCCFYADLFRRFITNFWEELIALSVRCMQPTQQQGRRLPSVSSATVRSTWFFLVAAPLTVIVQHIHSLRARGVISSHAASALGEERSALRKSAGSWCTTPLAIFEFVIYVYYPRAQSPIKAYASLALKIPLHTGYF